MRRRNHIAFALVCLTAVSFFTMGASKRAPQGPLPQKRGHFGLTYDPSQKMVVMVSGAIDKDGQIETSDDAWGWDGSWHSIDAGGYKAMGIRVAYDASRKIIVGFGGIDIGAAGPLGAIRGLINGAWIDLTPTNPAMTCVDPGLTYDPGHQTLIILAPTKTGTKTYLFKGSQITVAPGESPQLDAAPAMCYDTDRHLAFACGQTLGGNAGATWAYDGTAWTKLTDGAPGGQFGSMAYDAKNKRVVYHGGMKPNLRGQFTGETWVWDGGSWRLLTDKGPAMEGSIAYDEARAVVVFVGQTDHSTAGPPQVFELADDQWVRKF